MNEQRIFQEPKWFSYVMLAMSGIGIGVILTVLFCYVFGYSETIQLAQPNFDIDCLCFFVILVMIIVLISVILNLATLSGIPLTSFLFTFDVIFIGAISHIVFGFHIMLAGLFGIYFLVILLVSNYFESLIKKGMKKYYLTIVCMFITLLSISYICPFVYELQAEHNIAQAELSLSRVENGEVKVLSIKEADWLLRHLYFQKPDEIRESFLKQTRSNYNNGEHGYYLIIPKTEYPAHLFSGHIDKEVTINY